MPIWQGESQKRRAGVAVPPSLPSLARRYRPAFQGKALRLPSPPPGRIEAVRERHARPRFRPVQPHDVDGGRQGVRVRGRSEEHTSELQSRLHLVCRLLLEKKKKNNAFAITDSIADTTCIPASR